MYLIEGFRRGRYPYSLSSEGFRGNPSAYRKWWEKRRATGSTPFNKGMHPAADTTAFMFQ